MLTPFQGAYKPYGLYFNSNSITCTSNDRKHLFTPLSVPIKVMNRTLPITSIRMGIGGVLKWRIVDFCK